MSIENDFASKGSEGAAQVISPRIRLVEGKAAVEKD